jgi:hypothetical protein
MPPACHHRRMVPRCHHWRPPCNTAEVGEAHTPRLVGDAVLPVPAPRGAGSRLGELTALFFCEFAVNGKF